MGCASLCGREAPWDGISGEIQHAMCYQHAETALHINLLPHPPTGQGQQALRRQRGLDRERVRRQGACGLLPAGCWGGLLRPGRQAGVGPADLISLARSFLFGRSCRLAVLPLLPPVLSSGVTQSAASDPDPSTQQVAKDWGKIDVLVHSLANGPEVQKALLDTSRRGYLAAMSASSYSYVSLLQVGG